MRCVLAAAGAVLAAAAIAAPAAAASPSPAAIGPAIGGAQLSGRGVLVNYPSRAVPRLPKIKASAWVIADAGTGQVLAAKDPHGWYRPASTLKVLTAISLIPALNPNAMVVARKQATTVSPNIVGLLAGHSYKVSDLFTALLTISANDAAMALAQATGSLSQGMTVINAEARHLQADDTVAITPNGLDAPGQHTSAYDLALFARQGLNMPAFLEYDQTTSAQFKISKKKSVGLWNQNSLLATYPGALGGKTALYADEPYGGQSGCAVPSSPNGDPAADSAINTTSHEQWETITDPVNAWYALDGDEGSDQCNFLFGSTDAGGADVRINGHGYIVQQEWRNSLAPFGCVMS